MEMKVKVELKLVASGRRASTRLWRTPLRKQEAHVYATHATSQSFCDVKTDSLFKISRSNIKTAWYK